MSAQIINQPDLFGGATKAPSKGYEVHEHCFVSGPRSKWSGSARGRIVHSHEGGDTYHRHPDAGPGSYTIDKDEWFRMTGVSGGGRKKFTKTPEGEQLERIAPQGDEGQFEIHVGPPPPGFKGTGAGILPAVRMMLACKLTVSKVLPFPGAPRKQGVA